jgi:mitogen-activated protein kinase 7
MLSFQSYTKAIDMWSVGCIFAEMLGGKPLFKGRDYVDQLNQILNILGTPDDATLRRVGSERAQVYIRSLPKMPRIPFQNLYPKANPLALDLLARLLAFDPAQRIVVEQALAHPYLAAYHDEDDEPNHPRTFDFSFERVDVMEEMKKLIAQEVMSFKASKQGLLNPVSNGPAGLRRKESLSTKDREALERSKQAAAQAAAAANAVIAQESSLASEVKDPPLGNEMDIDEDLERELGGLRG